MNVQLLEQKYLEANSSRIELFANYYKALFDFDIDRLARSSAFVQAIVSLYQLFELVF
jgi:hypothetical protein